MGKESDKIATDSSGKAGNVKMSSQEAIDEVMGDTDTKNKDQSDFFRQAMRDVTPIHHHKEENIENLRKKHRFSGEIFEHRRKMAATQTSEKTHGLGHEHVEALAPEAFVSYYSSRTTPAIFSALKKGDVHIDYHLDLHGYTCEEAAVTLSEFIRFSLARHFRCVRIIHGKSQRRYDNNEITLKSLVVRWLSQIPAIVAYCSCTPRDGGRGAVYALLECRKRKKGGKA